MPIGKNIKWEEYHDNIRDYYLKDNRHEQVRSIRTRNAGTWQEIVLYDGTTHEWWHDAAKPNINVRNIHFYDKQGKRIYNQ